MAEAMEGKATFYGWKYAHYFSFVARKDKNLTVLCKLCPGNKELSTAVNSTSNLSKHLQRQHAAIKLVAKEPVSITPTPCKQLRLDFHRQATTKAEVNKLVAAFIVEEMLPISTVESPSFRNILSKIQTSGGGETVPPDRKTFSNYLEQCYIKMEKELKKTFEGLEYVSTTADIWTCHNRSYLGMTAHWINPADFKRGKAAIACKRIKGRHTFDVVASEIEQIHSAFGLTHKVTATVTDNGSNFVKAFKMYEAAATDSDEEGGGEEEVAFTNIEEVLSSGSSEGQYTLPPHIRCASHTLNLISSNDVDKWLSANPESKSVYRSATAKCSALWTKCSRSTVASELVENICKRKLIVPVTTRWNSFHDALSCITNIPISELSLLFTQLDIKGLTEREYSFLKEYCSVMKPLTVALDILQGEDFCYFGSLLPTLEILMSKVIELKTGLSRMTASLPDVIVKAIKTRFDGVLENHDAQLAAVTLPKFKVRWLKEEERRDALKTLLIQECRSLPHQTQNEGLCVPTSASSNQSELDFFTFEEDAESTDCEREVFDYLKSGSEIEILKGFPNIKTLSIKHNTATPSSAPVERLFSLGSLVLTPRRNRLSDRRFEKLLLMRYNHFFDKAAL